MLFCRSQMATWRVRGALAVRAAGLTAALLVSAASGVWARGPETTNRSLPAVRVEQPPRIDGVLDDPCWKLLPQATGFTDEMLGTLVADQTTAWIGYDDTFIYVAFHCKDSEPRRIVAEETRRGVRARGDDRVRFRLNPFNSRRGDDESELHVNARGTQSTEIAGGRAAKLEWEGEWQAAGRIVEDGWVAEMAIPWRIFTRPAGEGRPLTMGINFERYQARTDTRSYWSNLGPQQRRELGGEWTGVVPPPREREDLLSILAYGYGGYHQGGAMGRFGLDARYQFTPQMAGVATWKPDFSNVEGDVTSIDFSYAERLPDERRPFFLEGGGFYNLDLGRNEPFASVRVPEFDLGGKVFGRVGADTNVGVLAAYGFHGRKDGVATVAHRFSPRESVGLQWVGRMEQAAENHLLVANAGARRGDWRVGFSYGRSLDTAGNGEAGEAEVNWGAKTFFGGASFQWTSRAFRARNGFVPFQNQRGVSAYFGNDVDWRTGFFAASSWTVSAHRSERYGGAFFQDGVHANLFLRTRSRITMSVNSSAGRFEHHRDRVTSVSLGYPALDRNQHFGISHGWGRQAGRSYRRWGPHANWRFADRLAIAASSEIVELHGRRQQDLLSIAYDLARDTTVGGRLVRRDGSTNWYMSLRRSGYGGTEYFVIVGDPNARTFTQRAVVKVIFPL